MSYRGACADANSLFSLESEIGTASAYKDSMGIVQNILDTQVCYRSSAVIRRRGVVLGDTTKLSIQASEAHYCMPRKDVGPYTEVEVASSAAIAGWEDRLDWSHDGMWVYAYVAIDRIESEIRMRGGVVDYTEDGVRG